MYRFVACVVCLLIFAPRLAPALELGAIEVRSALYEPLNARIPIGDGQGDDLEGLEVVLGSPAQFELAGVPRLQVLELLEFTVVDEGDGHGYIQVWTDEPIIEPLLTFLVDVDWSRGRAVRGYKLHLGSEAGGDRVPGASPGRQSAPEAERESDEETGASVSGPVSPSASGHATYGPVRGSDTLWSIAGRFRPDDSVSIQRMMLALLETNPEAFAIGNVNALNAGTTLRIPTRDEIGPDNLQAAVAELERQHSAWKQLREDKRTAPTPAAPASASGDSEPEPRGRIEVVSPDTTVSIADQREEAGTQALRNELALAVEEADAGRRENNELKLRLAEAEEHIRELNRLVDLKNEEIAALQAMVERESKPAPTEVEEEPGPTPTEVEEESKPTPMPFGLDALPVNPVFLVGGAGLLLIVLGVVALLRRRARSGDEGVADEDNVADPVESDDTRDSAEASSDDDYLLEVFEKETGSPDHPPRTAPAEGPVDGDSARTGLGAEAEERMAQLWQDDPETESHLPGRTETDDDAANLTFELDEVSGYDSDSRRRDDETGDALDIRDPADPLDEDDLLRELEAVAAELADDTDDRPGRRDLPGLAETTKSGADRPPARAAHAGRDPVPGADDDPGEPSMTPRRQLDDSADDGGAEAFSLEDVSEDEAQTKLDLAQVYMEMGDTDSARGFLQTVLIDGDADQREAARKMLAKLV